MQWTKLARAVWRLYKVQLCGAAIAAALLAAFWTVGSDAPTVRGAAPPRQLLGRIWFDHYPESTRDVNAYAVFLPGGIGLVEQGSVWRSRHEIFDFERRGDQLDLELIQDGRRQTIGFTVESCDEQPPFDICLTLDENPTGGPTRFYSFGDGEDWSEHLPWAPRLVDAARARTAGVPR